MLLLAIILILLFACTGFAVHEAWWLLIIGFVLLAFALRH